MNAEFTQINVFDLLRTKPDLNPYTLQNESGKVKLNFLKADGYVEVEMVFQGNLMSCRVPLEDLKEVVSRL